MSNGRLNGKMITEHMKVSKIGYGALAAEMGISPSMLRQMEEGYYPRRNGQEIVESLARLLGCSVGALVIQNQAKKAS